MWAAAGVLGALSWSLPFTSALQEFCPLQTSNYRTSSLTELAT